MARYGHSGNAPDVDLVGTITSTSVLIVISDGAGWPDGSGSKKFWIAIDPDTANEEHVLVTSRSGTSLTLSSTDDRGLDGTTAQGHGPGATVRHILSAVEADAANAHVNDTTLNDHTQYPLKSQLAFNVLDYGAVGDGVADDSPAIQDAIDAAAAATDGGTVYLPPGIYLADAGQPTGETIGHRSGSPVRIMGAGRWSTTIQLSNATKNGLVLAVDGDEVCDLTLDKQTDNIPNSCLTVSANYTAVRRLRVLAINSAFPIYYPGTNEWDDFQVGNVVDDVILDEHFAGDGFSFCFQQHAKISKIRHTGSRINVFGCSDIQISDYSHTRDPAMSVTTANGLQITGPCDDIHITNFSTDGSAMPVQQGRLAARSSVTTADLTNGNTYTSIPVGFQATAKAGDIYQIGGPDGQLVTVSADLPHGTSPLLVDSFVASQTYATGSIVWNTDDLVRRVRITNMVVNQSDSPTAGGMTIGDCDDLVIANLVMTQEEAIVFAPNTYGSKNVRFVSGRIPQLVLTQASNTPVDVEAVGCYWPNFTPHGGQSASSINNAQLNGVTLRILGGYLENSGNDLFASGPRSAYAVRGLRGYNPQGPSVTTPAVPASNTAVTNATSVDCTVFVAGGTLSGPIKIGGTSTGLTSGAFRVPAGQTVTAGTYSVAPTWQWFGD